MASARSGRRRGLLGGFLAVAALLALFSFAAGHPSFQAWILGGEAPEPVTDQEAQQMLERAEDCMRQHWLREVRDHAGPGTPEAPDRPVL
jgi:hypothetical protein